MGAFMKAPEVAERLGVTPQTVRTLARSGELPGHRLRERGHFRFDPVEVEEFLRARRDST